MVTKHYQPIRRSVRLSFGRATWNEFHTKYVRNRLLFISVYFLCIMADVDGSNSDESDFQDEGKTIVTVKATFLSLL